MEEIKLTRDFIERGYSSIELARMTRTGELRRIRRGAYADPLAAELEARAAHLQLLDATLRQSSAEIVASHISAAAVHGLPLWSDLLGRVQLTRDRPGGLKRRRYSQVRGLELESCDVVTIDGMLVTSLARTVLDLSCTLPMERAVAVGDAALRGGLEPAQLDASLERARRRHGIAQARRSIAFLDARSESTGESVSRVKFHQHGVPKPELQYDVYSEDGRWIARTDFWWPDFNTVGEFDGKIKYGRALEPDRPIEDVLFDEKRREDALRDEGKQVVRWIWPDLNPPLGLKTRLQRAFIRGRPAPQ